MTKVKETGAAPVSKYAAKKAARLNASANVEQVKDSDEGPKFKKPFKKKGIPDVANRYPQHFVEIALIIKNNAEIRRFTALGIINYLLQKEKIKGEKKYVKFLWNKFSVNVDGLSREYSYTEPFFLNCLVASFASFSANAQRTINSFIINESVNGVTNEEIQEIVEMTACDESEDSEDSEETVEIDND